MAALGLLAAPAAQAADFYAEPAGGGTTPGCPQADPCTLAEALAQTRANTSADRLILTASFAGVSGTLVLDHAQDSVLTIEGLTPAVTYQPNLVSDAVDVANSLAAGVTLRNLTISGAVLSGSGSTTVRVRSSAVLDDVTVNVGSSNIGAEGLHVQANGNAVLRNGSSVSGADGAAVSVRGSLTIEDSTVTNNSFVGINAHAINYVGGASDSQLVIRRSVVQTDSGFQGIPLFMGTGTTSSSEDANALIESSILSGGATAIFSLPTQSGSAVDHHALTMRNATVDAGAKGVVDSSPSTLRALAVAVNGGADATFEADIESSFLVEEIENNSSSGTSNLGCANTTMLIGEDTSANTGVNCDDGAAGNAVLASTPIGDLIAGDPASDATRYQPRGQLLDSGSTAPLGAGESGTDFAGAQRVIDGNRDCLAVRDRGALELQGQANTPPSTPVINAPATATPGTPVALSAAATDAEDAALTYGWAFGDGGSGTGAAVSHAFVALPGLATVTATDSGGCTSQASATVGRGSDPPLSEVTLSEVSVSPKSFKRSRPGSVRFRLSDPAAVEVRVLRRQAGRRRRGRCVKPTPKLKRARRCTRLVRVRSIRRDGTAGQNAIRLPKGLRPGRYFAEVRLVGSQGKRPRAGFRVVRR